VPQDVASIKYQVSSSKHQEMIKKWVKFINRETNAKVFTEMEEGEKFDLEKEINLDREKIKIGIKKIK